MRIGKRPSRSGGFTLLWVLMTVVVVGIGLAIVGPIWQEQVRRQREAMLIRAGFQYVAAIEHYYQTSPGSQKQFPPELDQLLQDNRFTGTMRHLRVLYPDPVNGEQDFVPVRNGEGRIIGVASKSTATPVMQAQWTDGRHVLDPAAHYDDWQFLAVVTP